MDCKWQVEIDEYANKVLAKHWPNVRRWPDVRTWPQPDTERVDVICGGFPCQDISDAGLKAGLDGNRSGLFFDAVRVVRQLRPRVVVLENVAAIINRGHDRVLGSMAELGFDGEWEVLPACAFGAPHSRERVFYVFYSNRGELRTSGPSQSEASSAVLHFSRASSPRQVGDWWTTEPEPCSVVYGIPGVVDELRGYGNAIVPQVAEWVGRRVVAAMS